MKHGTGLAQQHSEESCRALFDMIDESFCIIEMIFDGQGRPQDWRYLETNRAFMENAALKDAKGKYIRDLIPDHEEKWFANFGGVALTGKTLRFEAECKAVDRWYDLLAFRIGGPESRKVGILFKNITERKKTEMRLVLQSNLLNNVHDAIFAVDKGGKVVYWNGLAEEILGLPSQKVMGQAIDSIMPEEYYRKFYCDAFEPLEKNGCYSAEFCLPRQDGEKMYLDTRVKSIKDQLGMFDGYLVSLRDITARKGLEQNIVELSVDLQVEINTLKRLHSVSAALNKHHDNPQALLEEILDAAIDMTGADKGTLQLLDERTGSLKLMAQRGFSKQFIDHFINLTHDKMPSKLAYITQKRVINEDVWINPVFASAEDREIVLKEGICALQSTPLICSSGKLMGILSTDYTAKHYFHERELRLLDMLAQLAADAAERILYKEALEQGHAQALALVEELRRVDHNKNTFINTLSHEIRNPMTSIMMSLSLLEKIMPHTEEVRKIQEIARRQTNQLANLVDDLMDVSRISTNKIKLKKKEINLNKLLEHIIDENRGLFTEKGLELETELNIEPITLEADVIRLKQAVGNLLQNAAKFTVQGQKTLVTLSMDPSRREAVICVRDNGIGIMPEMLPDLFKPFMQVGQSLDRAQGGLGLGLAIVKGMVELHGGSVSAYSKGLGEGTEFIIRLPLEQTRNSKAETKELPGEKTIKPMRVMVIDDIPDVVDALSSLLRHLGHEVISAASGPEGITKIKQNRPEIVFCDIGLPIMSGYEVAENIRNDHEVKDTCLIALSGYAQPDDIEKAKKSGFDRHLAKPIDLTSLELIMTEARRNMRVGSEA